MAAASTDVTRDAATSERHDISGKVDDGKKRNTEEKTKKEEVTIKTKVRTQYHCHSVPNVWSQCVKGVVPVKRSVLGSSALISTIMVGKPGLWVGALGRHLFLKQTRRTKPDNATRPGAHDGTRPTHRTGTEGQRQGRPHTQDTRKQAPGNGRTDEPEIQVAFPTFRFNLRGGTTGRTTAFSRVPVLISRRQPPVSEDGNHPSPRYQTNSQPLGGDGNHPSPRYQTNSQPLGGDGNHPSPKTATTRLRDT